MSVDLFGLDELPPGEIREVTVGHTTLVVIRKPDGEVRALRNRCAHLGARLSLGKIQQKVVGDDVGQRMLSDQIVLRCPWHGYEYDVDTGVCPADPTKTRVRSYDVKVLAGRVVLEQ